MTAPPVPLPPVPVLRIGVGTAHGTFGELLQGALPGAGDAGRFLVTLPVARWSSARFEAGPAWTRLEVRPGHKTKALTLARALLSEVGRPAAGVLHLHSSLPEGKGLASSSADLVATARAVLAAYGVQLPTARLARMLAAVEPSDGVMYRGVVAFDHRRGVRLRTLGRLRPLQVVAVDQGGLVDTVSFNRSSAGFTATERDRYGALLERLAVAVAAGDLAEVGRVSTASATLNQDRMPHRDFAAVREVCQAVGGLGLVACHSGTMVGILMDMGPPDYRARLSAAVRMTSGLSGDTHLYRTLG